MAPLNFQGPCNFGFIRKKHGVFVGISIFLSQTAWAQFNFQTDRNRNSSSFVLLDSTREKENIERTPYFGTFRYQYFSHPLDYDQGEDGRGVLVSHLQTLGGAAEYALTNRTSLGVDLQIHQLNYYQQGSRFAFGDTRFFGRILLNEDVKNAFKVSLVPSVYVPTGNKDLFLSNPDGGAGLNLVVEKKWDLTKSAFNLGFDYFPSARYRDVDYTVQNYAGLGFSRTLSSHWATQLELMAREIRGYVLGDVYGGGEYRFSQESSGFFGVSSVNGGRTNENPQYRIWAGLRLAPSGGPKVVTQSIEKKTETIQTKETIYDCSPKPYKKTYRARALKSHEVYELAQRGELPYISASPYLMGNLKPGESSGVSAGGLPYVKDAQVVFAFDLGDLPKREAILALKQLTLEFGINKLWNENEGKTDMICLAKEKICSGDLYRQKGRQNNINSAFFLGKEPPNDNFMQQVPPSQRDGISSAEIRLPLQKLLENSTSPDPLKILYKDSEGLSAPGMKTIYFVVAHDVYVQKNIKLNIELSLQACTESVPMPSVKMREQKKVILKYGVSDE